MSSHVPALDLSHRGGRGGGAGGGHGRRCGLHSPSLRQRTVTWQGRWQCRVHRAPQMSVPTPAQPTTAQCRRRRHRRRCARWRRRGRGSGRPRSVWQPARTPLPSPTPLAAAASPCRRRCPHCLLAILARRRRRQSRQRARACRRSLLQRRARSCRRLWRDLLKDQQHGFTKGNECAGILTQRPQQLPPPDLRRSSGDTCQSVLRVGCGA